MRILFLTSRFPYPPLRGDQVRAYHQIRLLARRHEITLATVSYRLPTPDARRRMESLCQRVVVAPLTMWQAGQGLARVLAGDPHPIQTLLYLHAGATVVAKLLASQPFDVVHAQLVRTTGWAHMLTSPPLVVDLVDTLSASYLGQMGIARRWRRPALAFEASRLARYEAGLLRSSARCIVVSEAERQALGPLGERVVVNPNGVNLDAFPFRPGGGARRRIIFVGNLGYQPNADAVRWFVRHVFPRVRMRMPDAELHIVGPRASRTIRRLEAIPGVTVTGMIPDVHVALTTARVAVAPLRAGAGIQNKVLEAMAAGTPVVATGRAVRGIAVRSGEHCLVGETAGDLADAVHAVLTRPDLGLRLARAGRALVSEQYAWEASVGALEDVHRAAAREKTEALHPGGAPEARLGSSLASMDRTW